MKTIEIKSCSDCPMCDMYDMASGYGCNLYKAINLKESPTIKENKKYMPDTPDWCPLKNESTLFEFKRK